VGHRPSARGAGHRVSWRLFGIRGWARMVGTFAAESVFRREQGEQHLPVKPRSESRQSVGDPDARRVGGQGTIRDALCTGPYRDRGRRTRAVRRDRGGAPGFQRRRHQLAGSGGESGVRGDEWLEEKTFDRCVVFEGDSTDHVIQWQGGGTLDAMRGQSVRFHFWLQDASLYSFWCE